MPFILYLLLIGFILIYPQRTSKCGWTRFFDDSPTLTIVATSHE